MSGRFLFAYATHNRRYSVRAVADHTSLNTTVTMTVVDHHTGTVTVVRGSRRDVVAEWKRLHRENLR
jgi:hypothetical protein